MTERLACYFEACLRARRPGHRFCEDHETKVMARRPVWIVRKDAGELRAKELVI
jgi:hypothetical protein